MNSRNYRLFEDGGVLVEEFDKGNTEESRFTSNNSIYKEGTQIIYSYEHSSPKKERLLFQEDKTVGDHNQAWQYVPYNLHPKDAIRKVILTVQHGLSTFRSIPGYSQTIIKYEYSTGETLQGFSSTTGVVENEGNVWMHPPRDKYFRILELNPFPFIKAPYKIGNKWEWSLKIGSNWGDKRWRTWEGTIENKYRYRIVGRRKIETALGKIDCFRIDSEAESRLGKTYLTAFFSEKHGFVQMDYTNIDGSETVIKIAEFLEKKNSN